MSSSKLDHDSKLRVQPEEMRQTDLIPLMGKKNDDLIYTALELHYDFRLTVQNVKDEKKKSSSNCLFTKEELNSREDL
ncbi:hypothetical protein TNCV_4996371 [Trichonephila clavipes]|nr:hypothetical protein TNCV_4996371 [Trichonephila clavipes]